MLAAATCLYAYKGFSTRENVALNLAAVFAVGVAVLPTKHGVFIDAAAAKASCVVFMGPGYLDAKIRPILHASSAVAFFVCLAYVSIRRSRDTLRLLHDEAKREWYNRGYFLAGSAMVVLPATAVLVSLIAKNEHPKVIFWVETFGVWAFSAYWLLKSRELRETQADSRVAKQEVKRARVPAKPPANAFDRAIRQVQVGGADSVERIVPVNR